MSDPAHFPSPQFLAEHQHFVRRLAQSLARDESSAEDLVQETWLAVLASGSEAIRHPRAWLATTLRRRAINQARAEDVRRGHESLAARGEAFEDARLRERVSFQHSVVAAVLELEEPYRTVVMLRHFQGLSPAAIARRRRMPAATVRSQLARAHRQLRSRLEQREGGREAWCLALAGFLDSSEPALVPIPALLVAAGACVIVVGIGTTWIVADRPSNSVAEFALAAPSRVPTMETLEPEMGSARVTVPAPDALPAGLVVEEGPTSEQLAAKSLEELTDMLVRVEEELRPRLLTPPSEAVAVWAAEHPGAGMEFARVLDRTRFENAGFDAGVVGVRGGGAYYSFVTRSNSYDDQPSIELQGRMLGTSFYGAMQGILVDLGPAGASGMPVEVLPAHAERFAILSRGPALPESGCDGELKALLSQRRFASGPLMLGHTYVLRQVSPNEHDVLGAFVPIHQDADGITIAWKVLQSWPVPEPSTGPKNLRPRKSLAPEAWSSALSTEGLLRLLARIRLLTTERLMAIPDSVRTAWPDRPLARVLREYLGTRVVNIDGGGRFFNFATQSNDYQDDPDIGLESESLTPFGRPGLILDLGLTPVQEVDVTSTPPADERSRAGWEMAWTFERKSLPPSGRGPAVVTQEESRRFHDFRNGHPVSAVVGHTYFVRSIIPGEHDHLVAFEIVAEDEHGIWITWKILKTWLE